MNHFLIQKFSGCTPFAPLLATPESKGTSFENDTTKGCIAIVGDNDNVPISSNLDKFDADFISIDRVCLSRISKHHKDH